LFSIAHVQPLVTGSLAFLDNENKQVITFSAQTRNTGAICIYQMYQIYVWKRVINVWSFIRWWLFWLII